MSGSADMYRTRLREGQDSYIQLIERESKRERERERERKKKKPRSLLYITDGEGRHCVRHHPAIENAQSDSSIFLARFDTLRWSRRDLTETL